MKIKEGFVLRKMGEQAVVVSVGAVSDGFNGMIKLNETGEFLWNQLQTDKTEEQLIDAIVEDYDVSKEVAQGGVHAFVEKLMKAGIIE
jgi:hypothetical protein